MKMHTFEVRSLPHRVKEMRVHTQLIPCDRAGLLLLRFLGLFVSQKHITVLTPVLRCNRAPTSMAAMVMQDTHGGAPPSLLLRCSDTHTYTSPMYTYTHANTRTLVTHSPHPCTQHVQVCITHIYTHNLHIRSPHTPQTLHTTHSPCGNTLIHITSAGTIHSHR